MRVLIFGGTTEGRLLAEILRKKGIPHQVSVATEYGARIEYENEETEVLTGRKNLEEIADLLKEGTYSYVVDATHPFATMTHQDIAGACEQEGIQYLRLKRPMDERRDEAIYADSEAEAVTILNGIDGNILLVPGQEELSLFLSGINDKKRIFVRVLPEEKSIRECVSMGLSARQIIAMQGPFSELMNVAILREYSIKAVLMRDNEKDADIPGKLSAASACNVWAVVLKDPTVEYAEEEGLSLEEILIKVMGHEK